jgi:hypothetical protein
LSRTSIAAAPSIMQVQTSILAPWPACLIALSIRLATALPTG